MRRNYSGVTWGLAFIAFGLLMLLDRLNIIYFDVVDFVRRWWPVILVIIGVNMILNSGSRHHHGVKNGGGFA